MDSTPPIEDFEAPYQEYKEEEKEKKDELKAPYETPPDVVDVGDIMAQDRVRVMRRYAILSSVAYDMYNKGYDKADENMKNYLPKHNLDKELSDNDTIVAVKEHKNRPNDVIISYRGTQNLKDVSDWAETLIPAERFKQAQDKFDEIKSKYPNENITTTGHSLGGGLAHYVGKKNNVKSYIFNASPSGIENVENTQNNKSILYRHPQDPVSNIKRVSEIFTNKHDRIVEYSYEPIINDIVKRVGKFGLTTAVGYGLGAGAVALGATPLGAAIGVSALGTLGSMATGTDPKRAVFQGVLGYKLPIFNQVASAELDYHSLDNFLPTPDHKYNYDGFIYPNDFHYNKIRNDLIKTHQENRVSKRGNHFPLSNKQPIYVGRLPHTQYLKGVEGDKSPHLVNFSPKVKKEDKINLDSDEEQYIKCKNPDDPRCFEKNKSIGRPAISGL